MKQYIRSERANLFEPNVYIGLVVKLSGDLLNEEIEKAVCKAYEANEKSTNCLKAENLKTILHNDDIKQQFWKCIKAKTAISDILFPKT